VKWLIFFLVFPVVTFSAYCQNTSGDLNRFIENITGHLAVNSGEEIDIEQLTRNLEYYIQNPLNINSATEEDLERLWILNDFQIQSLLSYRQSMYQLASIFELQYVYGFNSTTCNLLAPFITVQPVVPKESITTEKLIKRTQIEYLVRSNYKLPGINENTGSPIGIYTKFTADFEKRINLGILAENDPGEAFLNGINPHGFDFYSAYLHISTKAVLRNLCLGDYRIRAGQGLLLWNGFGTGKSTEISTLMKTGQGIRSNTSKNEYNFLRGTALELRYKSFLLTVFGSYKRPDAITDTIKGLAGIKSISTSGYHRTRTEMGRKNNTTEKLIGAKFQYKDLHSTIGINSIITQYSLPFLQSDKLYKKNDFTGTCYSGFSADYKILMGKFQYFGESAYGNRAFATINGINFLATTKFYASVIYRYYPDLYFSPYSTAIGENSKIKNEKGFYAGFNWHSDRNVIISAYTDIFSHPWLSYNADKPSHGYEDLIEISYTPFETIRLSIRYKYKARGQNYDVPEQYTHEVKSFRRQNMRFHLRYQLSSSTSMDSRIELCRAGYQAMPYSTGYLIYHDVRHIMTKHTTLTGRYAFYKTEDNTSRIYAYEHDVLYGFNMPAYSGSGQKIYFLLRQDIGKKISAWLRTEITNQFEDNTIELYVRSQLRIRF
jgi:hypothetical protein